MIEKRWEIYTEKQLLTARIADELGISPITAQILVNRGIATVEEAKKFFQLDLTNLWDPFLLFGMDRAVDRIIEGLKNGEKIIIFGDYDVDGITGTSLLIRVFEQIGAKVDYYIPDRAEGYGLNQGAIRRLSLSGYTLIVTVDNGISCFEEVELANSFGIDVIITDHHEPPKRIPNATAVVNPKLETCNYPCPYLSGVGVVFKLCQALAQRLNSSKLAQFVLEQIDLVTLGTVADIVPLLGENRIITANGLKKIKTTLNLGLRELIKVAKLEDKEINVGDVGFVLAPRINAIGRLDNPMLGVELLTTRDPERAAKLAEKLDLANRKRQMIEEIIFKEAVEMIDEEGLDKGYGIVLASEDWHSGVIGIVASKLVERYYRPTILIAIQDGVGKGSARGIRGLNLYEALTHCQNYLENYGGHELAAGLIIEPGQIQQFREEFEQYVKNVLTIEDLKPYLKVDARVDLDELDFALLEELEKLEPHGPGNPRPQLMVQNVRHEHRLVGVNEKHLKLQVFNNSKRIDAIGFGMAEMVEYLKKHRKIDLVFNLNRNIWNGQENLQMVLVDLKPVENGPVEKFFQKAYEFLKSAEERELKDAERNKRQMLEGLRKDELLEKIRYLISNHPYRPQIEEILVRLLQNKNILAISTAVVDISALVKCFTAYQVLGDRHITCMVYPLPMLVDIHYESMNSSLKPLGLRVYKAHGFLTLKESEELNRAIEAGEVDILLLTPKYLEYFLSKFKKLKERIGFCLVEEAHHMGLTCSLFYSDYYRLSQLFRELNDPLILAVTPAADKEIIAKIVESLGIDEVVIDSYVRTNLAISDQRNIRNKEDYLLNVVRSGEKTVVYVSSPEMSVKIAQKLRERLPEMDEEIIYYHEGLSLKDRKFIKDLFKRGKVKVIISTAIFAAEVDIPDIRHVVFYQLNFNFTEFKEQCWIAGVDGKQSWIHLLYGEYDKKINELALKNRVFERDFLAKVYILLNKTANKQGQIFLTDRELIDKLNKEGFYWVNSTGLSNVLGIFTELQLIKLTWQGMQRVITLLPKPKQKLDLSSSIRYNEGITEKKVFEAYSRTALDEDAEKLLFGYTAES
ncbi:single-stranded-DNA-specific exonuclease RecJ [Anoxybacter fermentans]|uniref:Single-stranded-DNA-specific exonuclease RecJ n=1 Tax=Anoxybacter fermentans TaxID=1323375 RepID=A0A3Q9HQ79_9FIRM|nr:single-stranded-DNA-specific exonuclease RecJ [Anoxybacter fermentans]AZR73093.1 single-stranded-DNA-specific exonuclease RecJ [Anoxybacter fermentans]